MEFVGTPGPDTLTGTPDDDTLTGGPGDDDLLGGGGLDVYFFEPGFGNDTITEITGTHGGIIRFGAGIAPEDVRLVRATDDPRDLMVVVGSDSVRVVDFFSSTSPDASNSQRVQRIEFDGGEVLDLSGGLHFVGTDQADTILGSNHDNTLEGLAGNDTLHDGGGASTLAGGAGDDDLLGGFGFDVHIFEPGFGNDTITEMTGTHGGIIRFGAGIAPTDLRFERTSGDPRDLSVIVGSDSIRVVGFYNSTSTGASNRQTIDRIEFADGQALDMTGAITFEGTPESDTILGTNLGETIIGGAGDDSLSAGSGLDVYVFEPGFGNDTITESTGTHGGIIRFGAGIAPEDVRLVRATDDPRDLMVVVGSDSVRVVDFFSSTTPDASNSQRVQRIEFDGGEVLDLSGGLNFVGTADADTILGSNHDNTLEGLAGNDTLHDGSGASTLIGGVGDDDLLGGFGLDVHVFEPGFGNDTITEMTGTHGGIIRFGAGIAPEDVRLVRATDDPRELMVVVGSDSVRVLNFFHSTSPDASNSQRIQRIEFDGGEVLDISGGLDFVGTADADTILGSNHDNTLEGLAGNDTLHDGGGASILAGGAGDDDLLGGFGFDVHVFEQGFGNDTITEMTGTHGGIIRFGAGIAPEDVRLVRATDDPRDLMVVVGSDSARVLNFFNSTSPDASNSQRIQRIEFDGGEVLDISGGLDFVGTDQADTILGSNHDNTLDGLAGNDTLHDGGGASILAGGAGDDDLLGGFGFDVHVFEPGFGNDTITEMTGTHGGIIRFGAGIAPEDVRLVRATDDPRDLMVVVGSDSARVLNFFNSTSPDASNSQRIQRIEFDGGEVLDISGGLDFVGTDQADTILGSNHDNTLDGLAGNDTLHDGSGASTLIGGVGDDALLGGFGLDVHVFEPGFGNDTITELPGTHGGIIRFGAGIAPEDVRFVRAADDARDLMVVVGSDSVRVLNFFSSTLPDASNSQRIQRIEFDGGQQLSLEDLQVDDDGFLTNRLPSARDDFLVSVDVSDPVEIDLLGNDSDPDGDDLSLTAVSDQVFQAGVPVPLDSGATVSVGEDGNATYTPDPALAATLLPGQSFIDSFNYQIGDGRGGFDFATVTVTLKAPDPVELALDLPAGLAPGEVGTAQLGVTVNGLLAANVSQAHLIAVSADRGLVADGLGQSFTDTAFVLARGIAVGETGTLDVSIKGTAGPRSSLSATAQLADSEALTDIAARFVALQPSFVEASVLSRVEANLVSRFGETIGSLANTLSQHADRFDSFGLNATSATAALAFAIEAAGDYGSLEERGKLGSLGPGWSTLADVSLAVDGGSVQMRGLTDIDALRALSLDATALYTISNSAGRSVALSGDVLAIAAPTRPAFEQGLDGGYQTTTAFDGTLVRTADGFRVELSDGDALVFDADGNFLRMEMPDGRQIVATHDADMRITGLSGPNGAALTFTRNSEGKLEKVADADGRATEFAYDADGRLQTVARAEGQSSFEYAANGDLTRTAAPGEITSEFAYDASGRLDQASYGGGAQSEDFAYDDAGGLTITDGAGRLTEVDLLPGSVVGRITNGAGGASEIIYDADGNIAGVRAPDGTETRFAFDDQGRLTKIIDANGAELAFTYGETGEQPESFTDAGGNTRSFLYDAGGRITEATWPDGTTLQFEYDDQGNLTGYANRRGDDVTYTYDASGRLLSESDSSAGPTTYTYDVRGRLTSATNDQGTTSLTYDGADRVTQIDYATGKSLSYTYNDAGLRASISDGADYNVFYDYDGLGRLVGLRDEDGQIVTYQYDGAGNLVREENGNGTVSIFDYDDAGRLTRIENQAPDGSVNSFNAYTYDAAGQRVTNESQDGVWTYGYDAIGQLTSAEFVSVNPEIADKSLTYEYDAAGNRTLAVEDGIETLYTANALNQYTQVGEATFTYDADGNMTSRTDGEGTTTYSYDLDNRLVAVTEADGTVLEFEYDLFGNRVAKTVDGVETEYLVDPFGLGDVVSEFTGGSLSATYAHGLGLVAGEIGGQAAYYDSDALGTVTTLTGTTGDIQNRYAFTPFGSELFEVEGLSNSFEFNGTLGVVEDRDGLTYMRVRNYSHDLGRFLGEEPLFLSGDIANFYRFAFNSPNLFVDSTGNEPEERSLSDRFYDRFDPFGNRAADRSAAASGKGDQQRAIDAANEAQARQQLASEAAPAVAATIDAVGSIPAANLRSIAMEAAEAIAKFLFGSVDPAADAAAIEPQAGSPSAASDGDPHLRTFDGTGYSFQAAGEFTMVLGDGFEMQTRMEAITDSVSVNSATAISIGDNVVGVYAREDVPLVVNGTPVSLEKEQTIAVGDGSVYRGTFGSSDSFDVYVVTDGNGNGFWVNVYAGANHLRPFVTEGSQVAGLLGNLNGDRSDDFALRDGTVLPQPLPQTVLYGAYADSWRISQENSLFIYGEDESTETYTDPGFPTNFVTLDDLDPDVRAAAEEIAIANGLVPGTFEFETTVLDIAITGNPIFAEGVAGAPIFAAEGEQVEIIPVEVNEAPIARPDEAAVGHNGTVLIDVLANDEDPEGDPLEILGAGDVNGGTVEIVDGQLRFAPAAGFSGQTVLSYQLGDGMGNAVLGSVIVEVAPGLGPVAVDDLETTDEDTALVLDVLANDSDPDSSDTLTVTAATVASELGTATIAANGGSISYDPGTAYDHMAVGESATVEISYEIADGNGGTAAATATVTVTGVNDDPVAQADSFSGPRDQVIIGNLLSDNGAGPDSDIEGDPLTVVSGSFETAQGGNVTIAGNGTFAYSPDMFFVGNDSFAYTLLDGVDGSAAAQVTLTLTALDGEISGDDGDNVIEGGRKSQTIFGLDGNDILSGGRGADVLAGGAGGDQLRGGRGDDLLIGGTGDDTLTGGRGWDQLIGGDGADTLTGGRGSDQLTGGDGADTLTGGRGSDQLTGGDGADTLTGGRGSDQLTGGDGADTLTGGRGSDQLTGGDGADTLTGGRGSDQLTGGDGSDHFTFARRDGTDTITDFEVGLDILCVGRPLKADSFAQLGISQVGADATIQFGGAGVVLSDTDAESLTSDDFLFL